MVDRLLADSSVWIAHLRGSAASTQRLVEVRARGELVICEPVAMELLAGAAPSQVTAVDALVNSIPALGIDTDVDFRSAAAIRREVRSRGHTVRSIIDCLIAAIALRHNDIVVVHDDVDFERIADATGLRHQRWVG